MKKTLLIIVGRSGSGKTTLLRHLVERDGIARVITHTTRQPRQGERNGRDYYFETPRSWRKLHLVESTVFDGHHYGSSREALQRAWKRHSIAGIVLDGNGARAYQHLLGKQTVVIRLTGRTKTLRARMLNRGDDPKKVDSRTRNENRYSNQQDSYVTVSISTQNQRQEFRRADGIVKEIKV